MSSGIGLRRLAIGLGQGLALYLLVTAVEEKQWPATDNLVFAPLLLATALVPLLAIASLGQLRLAALLPWLAVAATVLVGIGLHDAARGSPEVFSTTIGGKTVPVGPSTPFVAAALLLAFVAQSLVLAGAAERRWLAPYAAYFDAAWKHALQFALAAAFLGAFWALLFIGAALFKLIGLDFLERLVGKRWFAVPASTLVFACAVHVTDVRIGIIRGVRSLGLTLLSWLLPLLTLIAAGFLAALPFTGLEPLWATKHATALLLGTAAWLVLLLNAAYQDGAPEPLPAPALRYAGRLAALLLLPLVAIAAYALSLRVAQHGWTPDRIFAAAALVLAFWYAAGYAVAALRPGPWMRGVASTNVLSAGLILALLLALFTPLADPARISVASQLARLQSGSVPAETFDYAFLLEGGARYGREALERLRGESGDARAREIASRASAALQGRRPTIPPDAAELRARLTVHPPGTTLPESFLRADWHRPDEARTLPQCLRGIGHCEAFRLDLDGDGPDEIVVIPSSGGALAAAFGERRDGGWQYLGRVSPGAGCVARADVVRRGEVGLAEPQWRDVQIGDVRFRLEAPRCGDK